MCNVLLHATFVRFPAEHIVVHRLSAHKQKKGTLKFAASEKYVYCDNSFILDMYKMLKGYEKMADVEGVLIALHGFVLPFTFCQLFMISYARARPTHFGCCCCVCVCAHAWNVSCFSIHRKMLKHF